MIVYADTSAVFRLPDFNQLLTLPKITYSVPLYFLCNMDNFISFRLVGIFSYTCANQRSDAPEMAEDDALNLRNLALPAFKQKIGIHAQDWKAVIAEKF